jgi:hypothetical protein
MRGALKAAKHGRRVGLSGSLVCSLADAAVSLARNRNRLRDPFTRRDALRDIAWDSGESAASGVAGLAASVVIGSYLASAGPAAVAIGATFTASVVVAPAVATIAVGYAASRAVQHARRRASGG